MSNRAYVLNRDNLNPLETLKLVQGELLSVLDLATNIRQEGDRLVLSHATLEFSFLAPTPSRYEFYDADLGAFSSYHPPTHPYWQVLAAREGLPSSGYEFVMSFIKHFLARHNKTVIDSEGAGEYEPLSASDFSSFSSWTRSKNNQYPLKVQSQLWFQGRSVDRLEEAFFPTLKF